jgi:hypothetical protein
MPAGFSRRTGEFLFWASPGGKQGGAWSLLSDDQLIAGVDRSGVPHKGAYDAKTGANRGDVFAWFPGLDMVVRDKMAYVLTPAGLCHRSRCPRSGGAPGYRLDPTTRGNGQGVAPTQKAG